MAIYICNPGLEGGWGGDGDRQTARAVSKYQVQRDTSVSKTRWRATGEDIVGHRLTSTRAPVCTRTNINKQKWEGQLECAENKVT